MTTVATKPIRAVEGALYAMEVANSKYGPQISGKDQHIALTRDAGFEYSGAFRFDLLAPGLWDGVLDISKAVITFTNVNRGSHPAAKAKSGFQLRRLTKAFEDNSKEEGEWEEPDKSAHTHYPTFSGSKDAVMSSTALGAQVSVDITDWLRSYVPTRVKVKGHAGLGGTHGKASPGFWVVRRVYSGQKYPAIVFGSGETDDDTDRPTLNITYATGDVKGSVILTGPDSPIATTSGVNLTGTYVPGVEGARLARVHLQIFKRKADNSGWEANPAWQNGTTGEAASASEVATGDWVYPLSGSPAYPIPGVGSSALFVSGQSYAWRARCQSNKGVWTDFTGLTVLALNASAPVFEARDLLPNASRMWAGYTPPTMANLLNVQFGGTFRGSGANLTHGLMAYRVQVRSETDPSDPDWDSVALSWDSGEVPVPADQTAPLKANEDLTFGSNYRGSGLEAGTYSYRVRVTNTAGEQSPWRFGTFELTEGQRPDPSLSSQFLTGYARRHPRVRIRLRSIDANPQRVLVNATGGYFRLSYDGHTTGELPYNATAAAVQAALRALPGVGDATTVGSTGPVGKITFTVTFAGPGTTDIPLLKWVAVTTNHKLTGGTKSVSISVSGNRRPGRTVGLIDDAAHIGASEYYNSPGEFYFTLPHTHPQIASIDPWATHYELEFHRGNGWEVVAEGLIHDFDASPDDVVFYGFDYLGILAQMIDERFNPLASPKAKAYLYGEAVPAGKVDGSYYENRTIKQIVTDQIDRAIHGADSPLGFFTRGPIADMTENIIIYCTFKPRLQFITGLLESWKGKGAVGKRTRIRAIRTVGGGHEFRVDDDPGFDRPNLRMEYGGLVNGFRLIPYGTFGTRVHAIGQEIGSSQLQYTTVLTPVPTGEDANYNENRYGRWPTTNLWQDITDKADLSRRANQFARSLGRVGKQLALGIRVDAMMLKDGWDITDSIPVHIRRGIIDTTRYATTEDGESYWTIWGWVFRVSPDGHTDLTLSILPKENNVAAADDLTPSAPILSNLDQWQLAEADPTTDDADGSSRLWTNTQTGETFRLDPETGEWISLSQGATKLLGSPRLLANGNVANEYVATDAIDTANIRANAVDTAQIAPLAVATTKLAAGAATFDKIDQTTAQVIRPVADSVSVPLPNPDNGYTPNPDYPVNTIIYDLATKSLMKNVLQSDGLTQTWTKVEGVPGPEGSIPSYPENPDLPTVVAGLPALPNGAYPVNTQVYDSVTQQNYVNVADAWQAFDFEIDQPIIYNTSTGLLMKYQSGVWVNAVNATDLSGTVQGWQIAGNSITGNHIVAGEIDASKLAAQVVLASIFRTALSGQRIEWDTAGFRAFDAAESLVLNLPTAGTKVTINAEVWAKALTVDPVGGSILGGATLFPGSAVATLANGVPDPTIAPTVVDNTPTLTLATAPSGAGFFYDSAGGALGATPSYWVGADPSAGGAIAQEFDATTGALLRTLNPSNTSTTTTETVGATTDVYDDSQAWSGTAYNDQIATPITIPTRSGTIKVTAVSAWFGGYGGSCTARTMLWNSSGTLLGSSASFTAASESFPGGSSRYNKSLGSKVAVSSGQVVRAGFARSGGGFQYDRDAGSNTTYTGDGTFGNMTGVATDTGHKPNVSITIEVTNTVTVEGTLGVVVGIARAGSYLWVLDSNGKLLQYNQATLAYVAQFPMAGYITGVKANAGLFYDGTNLVILTTHAAAGASTIDAVKVSTAGAYVSTTSGASVANAATVVLRGGYNDGTNCWLYNSEVPGVTAYNKTTYALVANRDFGSAAECAGGVTYTTAFRSRAPGGNKVTLWTAWDWSTATDPYWFAYAWAQAGVAETAVSPRTSITLGRRRSVSVSNPALPGSPVDKVRVYALPNATSPAGTAMKRQSEDAAAGRSFTTYNSGGTAGLSTTSFGSGTAAEIKSQVAGWSLKGDGTKTGFLRFVPTGDIAAVSLTNSGAVARTRCADLGSSIPTNAVAVSVRIYAKTNVLDLAARVQAYDYNSTAMRVEAIPGSVANYYFAHSGQWVTLGGTNNRQFDYAVASSGSTISGAIVVNGYWTIN